MAQFLLEVRQMVAGKEKEKVSWLSASLISLFFFNLRFYTSSLSNLKHLEPHVRSPHWRMMIAKVVPPLQALQTKRNTEVVINRPTRSAFSSLHFTDDPSHSVFSSSSAVQVQSSPAGLKRFTYKRLFYLFFLLLFLPSCLVIVHCANYSVLCSFDFWPRCSEILVEGWKFFHRFYNSFFFVLFFTLKGWVRTSLTHVVDYHQRPMKNYPQVCLNIKIVFNYSSY